VANSRASRTTSKILHSLLRGESTRPPKPAAAAQIETRESDSAGQEDIGDGTSVKKRLAKELHTLGMPHPDTSLLRHRMMRNSSLDVLDLNDFLFDENDRADQLGRRALAAILCLEEYRETDLKNSKHLDTQIGDEIFAMLQFAERVGNNLADALQTADNDSRSRLLSVSNSLLNSRLQVERAVVRFAAPVKQKNHEPRTPKKEVEIAVPPSLAEVRRTGFFESHKWLMVIAFLVILVSGSLLLYAAS
jgi:hypothetical protein